MNVIEYDEQCQECKGTGVFVGMAERDGVGVVCYRCKGRGNRHIHIEYEPFTVRRERADVAWVIAQNPGIVVGAGGGYVYRDFGGMPYADWVDDKPFPPQSEMRRFVCPRRWFGQGHALYPTYEKCPNVIGGLIYKCDQWESPERWAECWARWDMEHAR